MTRLGGRGLVARLSGGVLLVAVATGCSPGVEQRAVLSTVGEPAPEPGLGQPGFVPVPGQVPPQPMAADALPPALVVANGIGGGGPYRAWIYRTRDGMVCFELATANAGSGASCGSRPEDVIGLSATMGGPGTAASVTGGTRDPSAVGATVTLRSGQEVPVALVRPGGFVPPDVRVFVYVAPLGEDIGRVDIVDAAGTSLESFQP